MNTALILIDIQNDYFPGGKMELVNPDKAAENARQLLDRFRERSLPVVHVQHIANRPTATFFLPDTVGAAIHNKVAPEKDEKIIVKHVPNSFIDTGLFEYLKSKNITNLIIGGMMTHMCIDATTRAAKDLGFNCILIGDACATKDLEIDGEKIQAKEVHQSFLAALNYYYATVTTTTNFLENNQK